MKKLLLLLLALCLIVPVFALASCDETDDGQGGPAPHTHTYATQWTQSEDGHYKAATCGHGDAIDVLPHVDGDYDAACDDCGYAMPPHIHTETFEVLEDGKHVKKCSVCKKELTIPVEHYDGNEDGLCDQCGYGEAIPKPEYFNVTLKAPLSGTYQNVVKIKVIKNTVPTAEQLASINAARFHGYGFAAWYYDEEFEQPFDPSAEISNNITLYGDRGNLAGDEIVWSYDEASCTLQLTGEGDMYDFESATYLPWAGMKITSVTIDSKITSIGAYSFYATGKEDASVILSQIDLHEGITKIGDYAYFAQDTVTNVDFPDSLTHIGKYAFRNCSGLLQIDIGNENLEKVEEGAFANCSKAKYVIFNNAIEKSPAVFHECEFTHAYYAGNKTQFENLEIAYNNLRIELSYIYFQANYKLTNPGPYWHSFVDAAADGKCDLCAGAHEGAPEQWCYSIYYIPTRMKTPIAKDYVFKANPVITQENVDFRANIWYEGYQFESWSGKQTFAIGEKLTGDVSYDGNRQNKTGDSVNYSINADSTVLTIDGSGKMWDFETTASAPWNENSKFNSAAVKEIVIGSNVSYIGSYAFCALQSLESIEIKSNIVEISPTAFFGCENLKYVYYYGNELEKRNCVGLNELENVKNLIVYCQEFEKDGVCDICGDHIEDTEHVFEGEEVKCNICGGCKDACVDEPTENASADGKCDVCGGCIDHLDADISFLTSKGLVPTISYWKDVVLADETTVRITWCFEDGVLTVGGVGVIPNYASVNDTPWAKTFYNICLEESLDFKSIDEGVTSLVIRDGITAIGENAFNGLAAVADITISNNVRSISATAFNGTAFIADETKYNESGVLIASNHIIKVDPAKAPAKLLLPDGIISVADNAFSGCTNIVELRIPKTFVGATESSFVGLDSLAIIYYDGAAGGWNSNPIKALIPEGAQVYIFSNKAPAEYGYYWNNLNDPQIWIDWLPENAPSGEENA